MYPNPSAEESLAKIASLLWWITWIVSFYMGHLITEWMLQL
jgi:hypothetical protein